MKTLNIATQTDFNTNTNSQVPESLAKQNDAESLNPVEGLTRTKSSEDSHVETNGNHVENSAQAAKVQEEQPELSKEQLSNMAQSLQSFVESLNRSIEFSVDDDLKRNVITVKDALSGDVIRQIPSQEMLDLIKSLGKTTGILFNQDA